MLKLICITIKAVCINYLRTQILTIDDQITCCQDYLIALVELRQLVQIAPVTLDEIKSELQRMNFEMEPDVQIMLEDFYK